MNYQKIDDVIRELLEMHRQEKESRKPSPYVEPMLAMGSEGGRLVETVVRSIKPKLGLEIGTSSGFSALCAIRGALDTDFKLITVDFDQKKADWALENFRKAGVEDRIEIIVADAMEVVQKLENRFDYVLLDAGKRQNLPLMKLLLPMLNIGAIVITDNAVTHADEMSDFTKYVRNHSDLASGLMTIGNGIEYTIKLADRITENVIEGDDLTSLGRKG